LILVLVAIVVIVILALLGPAIGNVFSTIMSAI
jgi:pilus assembly protein Flp/PilA